MTLRTASVGFALLGMSILTAGCGCGSQAPTMGALPSGSNQMQAPADEGANHQVCQSDSGITVVPCRVKFDSNHPGPRSVMVTSGGQGDGNRHAIKESDDCASRNIAMIARDSNRRYTVTAGSAAGSCSARFSDSGNHNDSDGGQNGGASLRIVNNL
jgi:hypothetical protein